MHQRGDAPCSGRKIVVKSFGLDPMVVVLHVDLVIVRETLESLDETFHVLQMCDDVVVRVVEREALLPIVLTVDHCSLAIPLCEAKEELCGNQVVPRLPF